MKKLHWTDFEFDRTYFLFTIIIIVIIMLYFFPLYLVVVYYANSVFAFFLFLFKGSSKCGFFHLAVLFRFYRVLFLHHVFLSEQIKMMMIIIIIIIKKLKIIIVTR